MDIGRVIIAADMAPERPPLIFEKNLIGLEFCCPRFKTDGICDMKDM